MAQSVIINGATYTDVPRIDIPKSGGGTAKFYDTSDANAAAEEILRGQVAYLPGGRTVGTMVPIGSVDYNITTKAGNKAVPTGYTTGGTIQIASTEQAKIIPANIKSGVTILGVAGSLTSATISQDGTTNVLSIS